MLYESSNTWSYNLFAPFFTLFFSETESSGMMTLGPWLGTTTRSFFVFLALRFIGQDRTERNRDCNLLEVQDQGYGTKFRK